MGKGGPSIPKPPPPPPPPEILDITDSAEARQQNQQRNKEGAGGNSIATGQVSADDRQAAFDETAEESAKKKKTPFLGA